MTPSREHKAVGIVKACERWPTSFLEECAANARNTWIRTGDLIPIVVTAPDADFPVGIDTRKVVGFAKDLRLSPMGCSLICDMEFKEKCFRPNLVSAEVFESRKEIWTVTVWWGQTVKLTGARRQEPVDHLDWKITDSDDCDEPVIVSGQ